MTELKNICPACGAEVRVGAAFCFNCGKSLEVVMSPASSVEPAAEPTQSHAGDRPSKKTAEKTATAASSESLDAEREQETAQLKVRPAATSPKRPSRFARKAVEMEWTLPEEGPGAGFVLGAAAIGLVASLVFLVALYLK